jgi:hypothetical protein
MPHSTPSAWRATCARCAGGCASPAG